MVARDHSPTAPAGRIDFASALDPTFPPIGTGWTAEMCMIA